MTKKKKLLILFFLLVSAFLVLGFDPRLETTYYDYTSEKIPEVFNNFRIVQISDFHLKKFGKKEEKLIKAVMDCRPDVIVLTGDMVDENHDDLAPLKELLQGISGKVPIYYVSGNHDLKPTATRQYEEMQELFQSHGVIDLDDKQEFITIGGSSICFTGSKWRSGYFSDYLPIADTEYFNILLYHGSDYFERLTDFGYDLILSGHAHGGVVRLPIVGGVFGNDGSLFPEYDAGCFTKGSCSMISSRGLGDAKIPRFYNRPELVCVELHSK